MTQIYAGRSVASLCHANTHGKTEKKKEKKTVVLCWESYELRNKTYAASANGSNKDSKRQHGYIYINLTAQKSTLRA